MKRTDTEPPLNWVSARELTLPTDYKRICACSLEKIEKSHQALARASNQKLADFYASMGRSEIRSLRSRLFFVAAMLIEQTDLATSRREMIRKIKQLHRDNPINPSVATVYRIAAPLKIWLQRQCAMKHPPSVGDLRSDSRPLLLLTEENLLALAAKCKTARKFLDKYRPKRGHKDIAQASPNKPETIPEVPATDAAGLVVMGKLTPAMFQKLAAIIGNEGQLFALDEARAKTVRKLFEPR